MSEVLPASDIRINEPAFVFHQIPNCGSVEMVEFIHNVFAVVPDEPEILGGVPDESGTVLPIDTAYLSAAKMFLFRAHLRPGFGMIERIYPEFFENPRFNVILFVDEPLRMAAVTHVNYTNQKGEKDTPTFADFLSRQNNSLAFHLGATKANFQSIVDRYRFVGINSKKTESLDKLRRTLTGILESSESTPNIRRSLLHLRCADRARPEVRDEPAVDARVQSVGPLAKFLFYRRNALDLAIYRAAANRLAAS